MPQTRGKKIQIALPKGEEPPADTIAVQLQRLLQTTEAEAEKKAALWKSETDARLAKVEAEYAQIQRETADAITK